jgi:hypothetical protein
MSEKGTERESFEDRLLVVLERIAVALEGRTTAPAPLDLLAPTWDGDIYEWEQRWKREVANFGREHSLNARYTNVLLRAGSRIASGYRHVELGQATQYESVSVELHQLWRQVADRHGRPPEFDEWAASVAAGTASPRVFRNIGEKSAQIILKAIREGSA